jgi:hypothetical protein
MEQKEIWMLYELILNALIVINVTMAIIMFRYKLKSIGIRTLFAIVFGISAFSYLSLAFFSTIDGNFIGAIITVLACIFFSLEAYATTKWKLGESFPVFRDWFRSR